MFGSSHGDSSLSLRLFALGLRANNRRLLEPCCLGDCQLMKLRYCSPLGGSPWYVYFLVFLGPRPTYFSLLFFLWGCLISLFFCCWCHVAFPLSHVVVSFVFCLLPWAALLDSWLSYYRVCVCHVHIVFGVCLADPFSFSCCNSCPFDALGGATASPSVCILPTRSLSCPQGSRLRLPTGQPALGRNRPVSILVETSGCCCKGSGLICQQVSLSPHPAERARSGVWVGTSGPVDLSSPRWAPPYSSRPRQLSQRGRTVPRAEEKSHRDFW